MISDSNNAPKDLDGLLIDEPQTSPVSHEETSAKKAPRGRSAIILAGVAILAMAAIYKGYGVYQFGQTHVDTDNAYVTGDLVNISPQVSGTLTELKVEDGDFVHKGQLIATLDQDTAKSELAQAQANLEAAATQVPAAEANLSYTKLSTAAAIQSSQAAIATQNSKTQGSRMQVRLSTDTVRSQIEQAESQVAQAEAQAAQARAGIGTANAALTNARQAVKTAQSNAEAARSAVASAEAEADRAGKDRQRYEDLLKGEAVSKQQYDSALATSTSADANLSAAKQRTAAADSMVSQAKAAVTQAEEQLSAARSQSLAATKQIQVERAAVGLASANRTQVGIQDANVQTNEGQHGQAVADLQGAQAGAEQISVKEKQIATAKAQLLQAQAAVNTAKVKLSETSLFAPTDGYVVKHGANVGTAINPGQTVVTITRGNEVWVMANFKETQIATVREGQPVDLDVDGLPGKKFHGKVRNVIHATGSATTLLPPDNSTGNFTKIVQRVPVKISVDPKEAEDLRQGMSVQVTIDTASAGK